MKNVLGLIARLQERWLELRINDRNRYDCRDTGGLIYS